MNYPIELLPRTIYKKISSGFEESFLIRKTNTVDIIHPSTGFLRDEVICNNDYHLVGYSTNLGCKYKTAYLPIEIIGDKRSFFNALWNDTDSIEIPIFEQDFVFNDTNSSHFFLLIKEIHNKIKLPFSRDQKKHEEYAVSVILHAPTNCNFWHFEINWIDQDDRAFNTNKSGWKTLFLSSVKAIIRELAYLDNSFDSVLLSEEFYIR
jgi:hypothetical protein